MLTSVTTTRRLGCAPRLPGALLGVLLGLPFATATHAQDVPGSKDHPFIHRMPFSYIVHYSQEEVGSYPLVLGALPSDDLDPMDARRPFDSRGRAPVSRVA